jgi:hypothetical protein
VRLPLDMWADLCWSNEILTPAPARRKKDASPSKPKIIIPCSGSKKMAPRPATAKINPAAPQNAP